MEFIVDDVLRRKVYNGGTGKSASLNAQFRQIQRFTAHGSSGTYIRDDFTVVGGGRVLAWSLGLVQYNYGDLSPTLLIDQGHMPLDDFYGKDDPTGIILVCNYLK